MAGGNTFSRTTRHLSVLQSSCRNTGHNYRLQPYTGLLNTYVTCIFLNYIHPI